MMQYNHVTAYEKTSAYLEERPVLKTLLHPISHAITAIYFIFYAWLLFTTFNGEVTANTMVAILGAPLLTLVIVTVLRFAVARPRPYDENGAGITPLATKKDGVNNSFPSRHVACAFVISTVLLPFATGIALCLFVSAVALAIIRFALGLHYLSDLLGGAGIGVLCGALIFI